jgi:L-asparaginase/Glu-tRNA(Gln) amidotransferase subunit D
VAAGPDGPANLLGAVTVAGFEGARGLGRVVVFADETHPAVRVRKTHSTRTGTALSAMASSAQIAAAFAVAGQVSSSERWPF